MLTQLSTLKMRLGLEAFDTTNDILLTNVILQASARFACECHRVFDYGAGLTFEFPACEKGIRVDRPPVQAVSQFDVKTSEAEGWVVQTDVSYLLSPARAVITLAKPLGSSTQLARVTYTGGFVMPGTTLGVNQVALPDEIELACLEQAAYWYQRRAQLGLLSVSSDSGLVQQFQTSDLLPQVKAVMRRYERWVN